VVVAERPDVIGATAEREHRGSTSAELPRRELQSAGPPAAILKIIEH